MADVAAAASRGQRRRPGRPWERAARGRQWRLARRPGPGRSHVAAGPTAARVSPGRRRVRDAGGGGATGAPFSARPAPGAPALPARPTSRSRGAPRTGASARGCAGGRAGEPWSRHGSSGSPERRRPRLSPAAPPVPCRPAPPPRPKRDPIARGAAEVVPPLAAEEIPTSPTVGARGSVEVPAHPSLRDHSGVPGGTGESGSSIPFPNSSSPRGSRPTAPRTVHPSLPNTYSPRAQTFFFLNYVIDCGRQGAVEAGAWEEGPSSRRDARRRRGDRSRVEEPPDSDDGRTRCGGGERREGGEGGEAGIVERLTGRHQRLRPLSAGAAVQGARVPRGRWRPKVAQTGRSLPPFRPGCRRRPTSRPRARSGRSRDGRRHSVKEP